MLLQSLDDESSAEELASAFADFLYDRGIHGWLISVCRGEDSATRNRGEPEETCSDDEVPQNDQFLFAYVPQDVGRRH